MRKGNTGFQISFIGKVSMRNCNRSIDIGLTKSSEVSYQFAGSGSHPCRGFVLMPLSYLEHWPGSMYCVLGKTFNSHSASPHPEVQCKYTVGTSECQDNLTKMLGGYLRWTSIPSGGSSNTPLELLHAMKTLVKHRPDKSPGLEDRLDVSQYNMNG